MERLTFKEALEYLRLQQRMFAGTMHPKMKLAMHEAMEALEKQVPKKVVKKDNQNVSAYLAYCASCGEDNVLSGDKFCANCGQRLDWSVE